MRPTRDQWAMMLVRATAKRATCLRRNVGAVLLNKRGHLLATGYNGVASGLPHCNETIVEKWAHPNLPVESRMITPHSCPGAKSPSGQNLDACQAIHAEQNALLQCKDVYDIESCYVSVSPCITCTKLLLNTSCERVIFEEEYSQPEAKKLWESAGRQWIKFTNDEEEKSNAN